MLELQGLQRRYDELLSLGARVFFVGPQTSDDAIAAMDKAQATIPILLDRDGAVMRAFGIAFTLPDELHAGYERLGFPDLNPGTAWDLPVPATYVISQDGTIVAGYVNADYTHRMEPEEIVSAVRALGV